MQCAKIYGVDKMADSSGKNSEPVISCTISRQKLTRSPGPSGVYRNAGWEPCYPGSVEYRFTGDEIEREPMYQYKISLIQTVRNNGQVQKKRFPVATIAYWNIVEDFLDSLQRSRAWQKDVRGIHESRIVDGVKKAFPNANKVEYGQYLNPVFQKFETVKQQVLADYRKSEEYPLQMLKYRKVNGNNSGTDSRSCAGNSSQTENSETRNRQARCDRILKNIVSFKSISNKTMAMEIVTAGYKKMAGKYHPDNGGTVEEMQELNEVKKEMLRLLGE